MNSGALNDFICPQCRGELETIRTPVATDALRCAGCRHAYPVVNGMPRFVPGEQYAGSFGFQWNKFRRTQLDSSVGLPLSRDRLMAVTAFDSDMSGCTILEAGSGAGRFTEVLVATGADIHSFDLSTAVDANWANNGRAANLQLFQASIFDVPLREQAFDHVVCLGVLQHTPDPDRAFRSLARHVKPGGQISIDVYARRLRALVAWKYLLRP
ncbi:MAG TPA: methyltransferase domain-containing protein, partial [Povalibacter sp.]|nr:methyltransferase domain-containing protein [Povalibacter sp.]